MALNLAELDGREREATEMGLGGLYYVPCAQLRPLLDLVKDMGEALEQSARCNTHCDGCKKEAHTALAAYRQAKGE